MIPVATSFPAFRDDRGELVAVEFTSLPFVPQRVFTVASDVGQVTRGGHLAGCRQLLVLTHGRAVVTLTDAQGGSGAVEMSQIGAAVEIAADDHVEYELVDPFTSVLVLADRPFDVREAAVEVR